MNKTEKPFACTSEGCQMTFTNEDHLNIHQKKHDMVLNLGLTCKSFADQTPTPTRFIRNCEEVGLFQDLQNVNPFEETFRKAIEHSKNGESHVPEPATDDTLHTPHIFPHITEEGVGKFRRTASDEPKEFSISNVPTIDDDDDLIKSNKLSDDVIDLTACEDERVPCASETSSSSSSNSSLDILNYVGLTSTKSQVKEKIKVALQNKKQDAPPGEKNVPEKCCSMMLPKRPRKRIGPKRKLKHIESTLSIQAKTSLSFYDKNLSETEKRRAINRVAQMRSRERKKIWQDQLETEIAELKAENKNVTLQNQHLKNENMLLKTILLNHSNCSLSSLEGVHALISVQKDKELPTIVPKPNVKSASAPIGSTQDSPTSMTLSPQTPKIILASPFDNTKRKRLIDEATKLPKLMAAPDVAPAPHKIETAGDGSIIIFLK